MEQQQQNFGPPPPYNPDPKGYPPPGTTYPPTQGQYPPPQGQYPPPQGQYPPPQGQYAPPGTQYAQQPATVVVANQPQVVVAAGNCPNCRVGFMSDHYGCCAIFLAIFFFPIGILCCLAMNQKQCTHCGATF